MANGITPSPFQTGKRLIDGSTLNTNFGHPQLSSQTGITATASGTQATAFLLTTRVNNVTTVATAADAIKLQANPLGKVVWVMNNGANSMQVFGSNSDTINAIATATGIAHPAGALVAYVGITATGWEAQLADSATFGALVATTFNGNTIATGAGNVAATTGANLFIVDVKKSSADPAPATTGLVNVTGLTGQALVAGATYRFRCVIPGLADGTSGIKYAFKYTTATLTSIEATGIGYTASAVAVQHTTTTTDATLLFDQAAAVIMTILEGTMVVNAAGTVALQAGLHTGTTAAAVYVGGTMEFTRIA